MNKYTQKILLGLLIILIIFLSEGPFIESNDDLIWAANQQSPLWTHLSTTTNDLPVPSASTVQTATLVLDIDKDGLNDFVIGTRTGAGESLIWYRRHATGWERRIIDDEALGIEPGGTSYDIDQDGDQDIVMGGDYKSTQVWWWENPYPNYPPNSNWTRRLIKDGGQKIHHDQLIGDFDGDSEMELVFWNRKAKQLLLAEIPADPLNSGLWPLTVIYAWATEIDHEGLAGADIDNDGVQDIVGAGRWFKFNGSGYDPHIIDSSQEQVRVAVGQLIPGGTPEVVFVNGEGLGRLKWYELVGQDWVGHDLLGFDVYAVHSLGIGDIDLDGSLDIFAAQVRSANGGPNAKMWAFYGDGAGSFTTEVLQTGYGNHESRLANLDGDCDLDILGKPFDWDTPRLDIWINETPCEVISAAQDIALDVGWNLISSFVNPSNPPLETIMADVESNMVMAKNSAGQIYWPALSINDIGSWHVEEGYQIYMNNPDILGLSGTQVNPGQRPIELFAGNNIVSYLPMTAEPIDQALASISGSLVLAKNGAGELYWPEYGINQIGDMQPGEGYNLYLPTGATLIYPNN